MVQCNLKEGHSNSQATQNKGANIALFNNSPDMLPGLLVTNKHEEYGVQTLTIVLVLPQNITEKAYTNTHAHQRSTCTCSTKAFTIHICG